MTEELRETLRYVQLTFAFRLQATIEDIAEALNTGRLTSLPSPTRSLMEICAALKDVRRKEAAKLSAVLKLSARGFAEARPQSGKVVCMVFMAIADPIIECIPQALSDLAEMNREIETLGKLAKQLRHYLPK